MNKKYMRRKTSLILIMILTAGIATPLFGNRELAVKAAGEDPSVRYFATKEQLMSHNWCGTQGQDATGYLNFGKEKSTGAVKKWYIIGKDKGTAKDNVILFSRDEPNDSAAYFWNSGLSDSELSGAYWDKISGEREFSNGIKTETENLEYKDGSNPKKVYVNHYGVSDIRKKFLEREKDEALFSKAEQSLMLSTKISTTDTLNNKIYTVTDKLYAPATNGKDDYLLFGSGEAEEDMIKAYPKGAYPSYLWTRTPSANYYQAYVYDIPTMKLVGGTEVFKVFEHFQPAFDLDLTDVLFASAAPTKRAVRKETLTTADALELRLDGKNKLPDASVSFTNDRIRYNGASGSAYLVVQGRAKDKDWYCEIPASGGQQTVEWETVKQELPAVLGDETGFSKCKVWLETTDTSDGFTYAVSGTNETEPEENKEITSVNITDIEKPDPEKVFDISAVCDTEGVASHTPSVKWYEEDGKTEVAGANPEYEKKYVASIELKADSGYTFADKVTATVNGETAKISVDTDKKTVTVTYEFEVGPNLPRIKFDVDAFSGQYDGLPHSLTVSLNTAADVTISYGERGSDGKVDYTRFGSNPPEYIKAGKYPVYIKLESDGYAPVEDYEATITINPRPITIALEDQEVVWRKNLPVARDKYKITKGELASGDKIADVNITAGPSNLKAGETGWIALFNGDVKIRNDEGEDVSDCYLVTNERGKLTVLHNASLPPLDITVDKTKKEYTVGEELNIDDLTVTVRYEDGYTEEVAGFTTNAEDIDMSTPGEKTLVVTYQGEDNEITIRVVKKSDGNGSDSDDKKKDDDDKKNSDKKNNSSGSGTKGTSGGSGNKSGSSGKTSGTGIGGLISAVQTGDASPIMLSILAVIGSELTAIGVLSFKTFRGGRKKKG